MTLSCLIDDSDFNTIYRGCGELIEQMTFSRSCASCETPLLAGVAWRFPLIQSSRDECRDGEMVELPYFSSIFLCEACGDFMISLDEQGLCPSDPKTMWDEYRDLQEEKHVTAHSPLKQNGI